MATKNQHRRPEAEVEPVNADTAIATRKPVPASALALAPTLDPAVAEAFKDGAEVSIPANAEEVIFVPSYTVPIGATVQGLFGGMRSEDVNDTDENTGEVTIKTIESFLFRNLNNTGRDVWLRGGWNFGQLIKLAKTREGERITLVRGNDKPHPSNPKARIAQFRFYRG